MTISTDNPLICGYKNTGIKVKLQYNLEIAHTKKMELV